MTIEVKEIKSCDPWLVALSIVLGLATLGFGLLAVRNAKPFTCDTSFTNNNGQLVCQKVLR